MIDKIIVILFIVSISNIVNSCFFLGKKQSVKARGQVFCKGVPYKNTLIKLLEEDSYTSDDLMSTAHTDNDGYFKIRGVCKQFTKIDPKIEIFHRCGRFTRGCYGILTLKIPYDYVTKGSEARKWFEAGNIKLGPHLQRYAKIKCIKKNF
uniref:Transthyretin-like family protein n=1 Tax=Strongyloides stercoralis TaxID=6248 RepID=A0A0K0ENS9_STRER